MKIVNIEPQFNVGLAGPNGVRFPKTEINSKEEFRSSHRFFFSIIISPAVMITKFRISQKKYKI